VLEMGFDLQPPLSRVRPAGGLPEAEDF